MPRLLININPNSPPIEPFVAYDLQVVYPDIDIEILPGPPKIGGVVRSDLYNIKYVTEQDEEKRERMRRPINIKRRSEIFSKELADSNTGIQPSDHLSLKNSFYLAGNVDLYLAPEIGNVTTTNMVANYDDRYRFNFLMSQVFSWDSSNVSSYYTHQNIFISLFDTQNFTSYPVKFYREATPNFYEAGLLTSFNLNNFWNDLQNQHLFTYQITGNSVNITFYNNDSNNQFSRHYFDFGGTYVHIFIVRRTVNNLDFIILHMIYPPPASIISIYLFVNMKDKISANNNDDIYKDLFEQLSVSYNFSLSTTTYNNSNYINSTTLQTYSSSYDNFLSNIVSNYGNNGRAFFFLPSIFIKDSSRTGVSLPFFNAVPSSIPSDINGIRIDINSNLSYPLSEYYSSLTSLHQYSIQSTTYNYDSSASGHHVYRCNYYDTSSSAQPPTSNPPLSGPAAPYTLTQFLSPMFYNYYNVVQSPSNFTSCNIYSNSHYDSDRTSMFYFYPDIKHIDNNNPSFYSRYIIDAANNLSSFYFLCQCFTSTPHQYSTNVTTHNINYNLSTFQSALETLDMVDILIDNGYTNTERDFNMYAGSIAQWAINMEGEKVPAIAAINSPFRTPVNFSWGTAGIIADQRAFITANYFRWDGLGFTTLLPSNSLYCVSVTRNFYNLDEFRPIYYRDLIPVGPVDKMYSEVEREMLLQNNINSLKVYNNRLVFNNNLTTAPSTSIFKEENIVRMANAIARNLKIVLKQFVGKVNVEVTRREVVSKIEDMLKKTILINRYVPDRFVIICDSTNNTDHSNYLYVDIAMYVPLSAKYVYIVTMAYPI